MVDPDRRPTAQEIEELIDLVRRDPASPAFIDLGEAYLSLGRPRDALQVGAVGLDASPDNLEGRVMLARAHVALHQWKEAQSELLRVVKVDRTSRQGFALLGEVLLRRSDFERAVPVLQHAQNLDPTSPHILAMLRRARAGQPLDPPPPLPHPIPPRGETENHAPIQRSPRSGQGPAAVPRPPPPPGIGVAPTMMPGPAAGAPIAPAPAFADASAGTRAPRQTAPPPMSVEGVRPRIIANEKPQNAAAASLRQSAAVGETYLNDLLTGGLLDVAGVRVPELDYDLKPDRRWGRSTRRAFIFLFVVLVLGLGGGGTWYWWSEHQKAEEVAELQRQAHDALGNGSYAGVVDSLQKLQEALAKDPGNKLTLAYYVEAAGIGSLLFGETRIATLADPNKEVPVGPAQVDDAYKAIANGDGALAADDEGWREMQLGKAAVELSRLPTGAAKPEEIQAAVNRLGELRAQLDALVAADGDDRWALYLKARALLAAGDRRGAAALLDTAGKGDDGVVAATIDRAGLLTDDGKLDDALALYKQALDRSKDHPLAVIGQAIARAEATSAVDEVIGDLNAKFVIEKLPSRVAAWRWLALASASIAIDDYKGAADALVKAKLGKPPADPRFWARVAWIHYKLGRPAHDKEPSDLVAAADARRRCIWFAKKAAPDPTVQLVDAGLLLASGLPEKVIDIAAKLDGVRPKLLRAYALLDLGQAKEAMTVAAEIAKLAPGGTGAPCEAENPAANLEARTLCEQGRMISTTGKQRLEASEALTRLSSASKVQLPRHALGVAFLALRTAPPVDPRIGTNLENAKKYLKRAVDGNSDEEPNPMLYRSLAALGEVALVENDLATAKQLVGKAFEVNAGYLPTRALQARITLRDGKPDAALSLLEPVLSEGGVVTPEIAMTRAEALITHKGATAKDQEMAKQILIALKDKPGVSTEELARIAALIDPKLPEELELAKPEPAPPPRRPTRRRGRR